MGTRRGDLEELQQWLKDLQMQVDQQRAVQATAANPANPKSVNVVETLQLSPFWPLAPYNLYFDNRSHFYNPPDHR